ncbi:serine/threonine protein kinase [Ochrobactrum sp. MT180101]|nr:serine/threonine protein kinase [Ochrobactrum sp. MT180101]
MTAVEATLVLGEEIGRGHFGCVHIGSDLLRDRLAVKVMTRKEGEDEQVWIARRDGLVREGDRLHRAAHPNVVLVHYITTGRDGHEIQLSMEYCAGGSLETHYKSGPMNCADVRKFGKQVCLGLASLHDRGMVHRDIKPGNILISGEGVAKVSDFGLVTDDIVEGYAHGAGYTDHLAPEFYTAGVCSIKTDIWALGITLYRLLHGHDWYNAQVRPRFLVRNGGFAQTLKWLPHISDSWRRTIKRMLSDDSADRPSDMRDVSRLLGSITVDNPWACTVAENQISWRRNRQERIQTVQFNRHSSRSYSWSAFSASVAPNGRNRQLGGAENLNRIQAERELRSFFNAH